MKVDKASNETINKICVKCKWCELNEKGEKTGEGPGKDIICWYLSAIFQVVKFRDVKNITARN